MCLLGSAFLRKFMHDLANRSYGKLHDFVDFTLGGNQRRSKAKNVSMRHGSCNKTSVVPVAKLIRLATSGESGDATAR